MNHIEFGLMAPFGDQWTMPVSHWSVLWCSTLNYIFNLYYFRYDFLHFVLDGENQTAVCKTIMKDNELPAHPTAAHKNQIYIMVAKDQWENLRQLSFRCNRLKCGEDWDAMLVAVACFVLTNSWIMKNGINATWLKFADGSWWFADNESIGERHRSIIYGHCILTCDPK